MHDNSMKAEGTVSEQLKRRRMALGLSLSEVARRAGTSAATLSRYENGWTRFETYTLRKLATALDCDLSVEFRPKQSHGPHSLSSTEACKRLKRLFWDHPLRPGVIDAHPAWVVERVLDYGVLEDVRTLCAVLGREAFLSAVAAANRVSPRTRNFWRHILELEGMSCTKKYSRDTAWNY